MAYSPLDFRFIDNQGYSYRPGELPGLRRDGGRPEDAQCVWRHGGAHWHEYKVWAELANQIRERLGELGDGNGFGRDRIFVVREDGYSHDTEDDFFSAVPFMDGGFSLRTGNLVGSVIRREDDGRIAGRVTVGSRFGDVFLRHIISDADGFVSLQDMGGAERGMGCEWLLDYLWNVKFRAAYRLGLPKCYCSRRRRLPGVMGSVDVLDYYNYETTGLIGCSYRELSYDNPAAELFVAAWTLLRQRGLGRTFCGTTSQIYQAFAQAVRGGMRKRNELLKVKPFGNPFYAEYNKLIDLSKVVLRCGGSYFGSEHCSDALLFDVSMLFEYFVRKLLKRNGFALLNKEHEFYTIPTGSLIQDYGRKLKPDLVFRIGEGVGIFDVKYKYFDARYGAGRDDLFQLHTYIGQYGNVCPVKVCGFIYPIKESRWEKLRANLRDQVVLSSYLRQQGMTIPFHIAFVVVPDNDDGIRGGELSDMTSTEFSDRFRPWVSRLIAQLKRQVEDCASS